MTPQMANYARNRGVDPLDVLDRMASEAEDQGLEWPPFVSELPAWRHQFFATCRGRGRRAQGRRPAAEDEISEIELAPTWAAE